LQTTCCGKHTQINLVFVGNYVTETNIEMIA